MANNYRDFLPFNYSNTMKHEYRKAKENGMTGAYTSFSTFCKANGLVFGKNNHGATHNGYSSLLTKEYLQTEYFDKNRSARDIAEEHGITTECVKFYVGKFKLRKSRSQIQKAIRDTLQKRYNVDNIAKAEHMKPLLRLNGAKCRELQKNRQTWIELTFEDWCKDQNIPFESQFSFCDYHHRYDYLLTKCDLIIELDGDYWHDLPGMKEKDEQHSTEAFARGYFVTRVRESQIRRHGWSIFDRLVLPDYERFTRD